MQRLQAPYIPQHRMAKIFTLLACVSALGVATRASAQTINSRPGTPQFVPDSLTREVAQQRYDVPDAQRPVGFEPQARGDGTVSTSWQRRSAVLVVAEGVAVLRRQTSRPAPPRWRRNSKTP